MIRIPGLLVGAAIPMPQAPLAVRFEGGRFVSDDWDLMEQLYAARDHGVSLSTQLHLDRDGFMALAAVSAVTPYTLITPGGEFTVYMDLHPDGLGGNLSVLDPKAQKVGGAVAFPENSSWVAPLVGGEGNATMNYLSYTVPQSYLGGGIDETVAAIEAAILDGDTEVVFSLHRRALEACLRTVCREPVVGPLVVAAYWAAARRLNLMA